MHDVLAYILESSLQQNKSSFQQEITTALEFWKPLRLRGEPVLEKNSSKNDIYFKFTQYAKARFHDLVTKIVPQCVHVATVTSETVARS